MFGPWKCYARTGSSHVMLLRAEAELLDTPKSIGWKLTGTTSRKPMLSSKTAQEMAAVSYQLGLAACRSLILGLGHASADSTLSAPTESSMGPDHLAGQAESVCGLLQASSSLG